MLVGCTSFIKLLVKQTFQIYEDGDKELKRSSRLVKNENPFQENNAEKHPPYHRMGKEEDSLSNFELAMGCQIEILNVVFRTLIRRYEH